MVLGGISGPKLFSDGLLVDCANKQVVQRLEADGQKFCCWFNPHCMTQLNAIVAVARFEGVHKLIEVSTTDFVLTELGDLD